MNNRGGHLITTPGSGVENKTRLDEITSDYINGSQMSEIAREHGLSVRRIQQIVQELKLRDQRKEVNLKEKAPLSKMHAKLGRQLYDRRYDLALNVTDASRRILWSAIRLRRAEQGRVDFTLMDMQDVSGYLGTSVATLLLELEE